MPLLSEQSRRKRNLVIITGFLLILGIASAFDLGVRTPDIPAASNVAIIALLNLNLIVFLLLLVLLLQPRDALVRAPARDPRLQVHGQARLLVPAARRDAAHRDLPHRDELDRLLDRVVA